MLTLAKKPRPYRLAATLLVFLHRGRRRVAAVVRDLSRGGVYVRTRMPLLRRQLVNLELELKGEGYLLPARVARVDAEGAGFTFERLPRDAELAIAHFLASGRDALEAVRFAEGQAETDSPVPGEAAARRRSRRAGPTVADREARPPALRAMR